MKRMSTIGVCLVAIFAFAAFASSAFALPEVGQCVAKAGTGKYKDSNCNIKAGKLVSEKSFEFKKGIEGANPEINSTSATTFLETENGTKIECSASVTTAKWDEDLAGSPPKVTPVKEQESVNTKFTGCTLGAAKKNCQNKGGPTGEIKTSELEGPLGYLSKAKKEVGAELKPHVKKGTFAEFECEGFGTIKVGEGTGKLGDCIIAAVTSKTDEMTTTGTELYTGIKGPEGQEQNPQHFEGKTTHCNLESKLGEGGWERSVQHQEETLTFETEAEIRA